MASVHRPENVTTSLPEAEELSDFTGLPVKDLLAFRPERLVVHELLIRVMADIYVSDGSHYGHLGINFRQIANTILQKHLEPVLPTILSEFAALMDKSALLIDEILATAFFSSQSAPARKTAKPGLWRRITGLGADLKQTLHKPLRCSEQDILNEALADLRQRCETSKKPHERAIISAVLKTVTAVSSRHAKLIGDKGLLASIALTFVGNGYGSEQIGQLIADTIEQAIAVEGYRPLPAQPKPIIMNVKGASAAGKSTLRPLQQKLADRIGANWHDFALISPDIWRKFLLDYDTLGEASKYAGMLTGHEIEIIDKKLDRYMAEKAAAGTIPHLLIDRFRFDSFAAQPGEADGGRLLTRFGNLVYMFFVITPPEATVERAWERGLEYGRYKAVDDLLDHNVEAFTGMPHLFFTWALNTSKQVHYEFLDNSVAKGERPRTVAFGWNGEMTILDIKSMLNVTRFSKINISANNADEVYQVEASMAAKDNTDFLVQCARRLCAINLANRKTGAIYAHLRDGKPVWVDKDAVKAVSKDEDCKSGLAALLCVPDDQYGANAKSKQMLEPAASHTLGQWANVGR